MILITMILITMTLITMILITMIITGLSTVPGDGNVDDFLV